MIKEIPEYIMINVPDAFFKHDGKMMGDREKGFRLFYEQMGRDEGHHDNDCFYHFISRIWKHISIRNREIGW